eukprot:3261174-Pyramimonas_sp.AAC.1
MAVLSPLVAFRDKKGNLYLVCALKDTATGMKEVHAARTISLGNAATASPPHKAHCSHSHASNPAEELLRFLAPCDADFGPSWCSQVFARAPCGWCQDDGGFAGAFMSLGFHLAVPASTGKSSVRAVCLCAYVYV